VGDGPSEIILLIAGLIVAALVSGVLLQSWDDMSEVLDDRGKQGAEDVRTRVSLASDPINIAWWSSHADVDGGTGNDSATIFLQNSGDTFLDVDNVAVSLNGSIMMVTKCDCITQWLPGEVVEFSIQGSALGGLGAAPPDYYQGGTYDAFMTVTVTSTSGSYAGVDVLREEVRIAAGGS
jgi:archaellum component FlaG (FlaF/FlaG flagellin family)|tara:strand:- start:3 stop:539 length:537 start_codon:yes stop_codon:yes gene_type:complete